MDGAAGEIKHTNRIFLKVLEFLFFFKNQAMMLSSNVQASQPGTHFLLLLYIYFFKTLSGNLNDSNFRVTKVDRGGPRVENQEEEEEARPAEAQAHIKNSNYCSKQIF